MSIEVRNFIDYFCVCGLDVKNGLEPEPNEAYYEDDGVSRPPLERSYKCKILSHFPDNLPWNHFDEDAVTQLCLPKGLMFQKHSSKASFHPFLITREDGSRVYAGALTFYELIEDESICNAMQALQTMYDAEYSSSTSINKSTYPSATTQSVNLKSSTNNSRIYSRSTSAFVSGNNTNRNSVKKTQASTAAANTTPISTKTPLSFTGKQSEPQSDNDQITIINQNINSTPYDSPSLPASSMLIKSHQTSSSHHYSIGKDRLYATKSICLISQTPFNKSFRKILQTLYEMVEQTDLLGMNLESHLYNLIYELPMPASGKLMQFHIGCRASVIYMPDYTNGTNDLPLFDYDLLEFFQLLGVNNTIQLYITALLEHQILLYSKDLYLLMLVAESLTTLFFPFTWLKPYVPIVPASNLHFIEAPVPYIMGFHNKDIDKEFFKQGQRCFVDIDTGSVTCPEGLPDLPEKNKFAKEINDLILTFTEKRNLSKLNKLNTSNNTSRNSNGKDNNYSVTENSVLSQQQENNMKYEILQNSQAFARISELARRAGAFNNSNSEEMFDKTTGRFKSAAQSAGTNENTSSKTNAGSLYSSSSGVSSVSSLVNHTNDFVNPLNNNSGITNNNNSINSIDLSNQTDDSMNSTNTVDLSTANLAIDEEELVNMQFNRCVRELFLDRFVQMFLSYEKFVIVPTLESNQIETWWSNREYSGNFDSKMFLIEQPGYRLPFLTHFIASQMFVSFIDLKIISLIDPRKSPDPNVKIFDERIRQLKESSASNIYDVKVDNLKASFDIKLIENDLYKKMCQVPVYAPTAHKLSRDENRQENNAYLFENIDANLLKADEDFIKKTYDDMKLQMESKKKFQSTQIKLKINKFKSQKEKKTRKTELNARKSHDPTMKKEPNGNGSLLNTPSETHNEKSAGELNPIFIQSLLKESKLKTKKMLVEKMPEAINMGHGEAGISGIEENMLIASLCDLIERIWGHGLHSKPGKSALWNHLSNYRKLIQYLHPNSHMIIDTKLTSPTLLWCLMKKKASPGVHRRNLIYSSEIDLSRTNDSDAEKISNNSNVRSTNRNLTKKTSSNRSESTTLPRKRTNLSVARLDTPGLYTTNSGGSGSPHLSLNRQNGLSSSNLLEMNHQNHTNSSHKRAQSVHHYNNSENQNFPPLKNDLLGDLNRIDKLTEVKTEIGMARAFVRLSLEKKLLADHLRQLLSESELLRALYKRHAFLRQEDEREQFIYHLQSLNVVDYFCFTNHFKSIPTDYSVVIMPSKRFNASTTSANAYMKLFGSLGESEICSIPKNSFESTISCNYNLGPLTTLLIGHDNAGMTPKWMIECLYVRNETTGHVHKFPCGRWLGKGVDDDSLERLLIAESISFNETYEKDMPNIQLLSPYHNSRSNSPSINRTDEKKLLVPAIQETLGNSVNILLKFFERQDNEKGTLTNLMCGEHGFVNSMENIFTFGFKSYKLFKRLYVWDFLEKAAYELEGGSSFYISRYEVLNNIMNSSPTGLGKIQKNYYAEKFINAIKLINSTTANYGKDGKFRTFICLACRDSLLSEWFNLLSKTQSTNQMYDEYSFLRHAELNKMCIKIISITNQFDFKLENSLTMGIVL